MTPVTRSGKWGGLALEAIWSLLLVLVLFSLFNLFLYALFPSGTPIKELMESRREQARGRYSGRSPEASLSLLFRDVRYRRGNSIAWGGATRGMRLYSDDAIQTFDRSGAAISFDAQDRLSVGSNSLVVVTRLNREDDSGPRSYRVQVDGELSGTLSAARKLRMELEAQGHLARMLPGAARFKMVKNGASSSSLAVYAGEAQVAREGGRMLRVPANYGVLLRKGKAVGPALALPAPPRLGGSGKALYRYRLLPPKVRFDWSGKSGDYHFQLSPEPGFKNCLIDERLTRPEFVLGNLGHGTYYWRVSGVRQGLEGNFSRVGRLELVQVLGAPQLQVEFPPDSVPAGPYTLTGSMEPGSKVYVDGVEVASEASGAFRHELRLKPGVNLIRVEAQDPAGNASYASRIVYGKAGPKAQDTVEQKAEGKGPEPL